VVPITVASMQERAASTVLDAELDNLRQALIWCSEHDPAAGLRLAGRLWGFWRLRGLYDEGRDWLTRFLALPGPPNQERANALLGLGNFVWILGDLRGACTVLEQGRALFHSLGDELGEADALSALAPPIRYLGEWVQARRVLEEALARYQAVQDQRRLGSCQFNLGHALCMLGDHEHGLRLLEAGVTALRAADDRFPTATALIMLGYHRAQHGEQARARAAFAEARAINQHLAAPAIATNLARCEGRAAVLAGDPAGALCILDEGLHTGLPLGHVFTADLLATLGLVRRRLGERDSARQALGEGLRVSRRIDYHGGGLWGLEATALVLGAEAWTAPGVQLLGAAERERIRRSVPLALAERAEQHAALEAARGALGDQAFTAAWTAGQALSFEAALDLAQALLAEEPAA
jgi:tetratricopeptide (TPR) repeat protein